MFCRFSVNSSQTIPTLYPGKMVELDMFVDFHQQLASAKLDVFCNMKHYPVRLVPDIGAFLRPKELTVKDFSNAESKLVGMFEILQRYDVSSFVGLYDGLHYQWNISCSFQELNGKADPSNENRI
jgi:hypothetical protein